MLTERHRAQLASSAISDALINARGYCSIAPGAVQAVKELARAQFSDKLLRAALHDGALMFPLFRCGMPEPFCYVLRPDMPRTNTAGKTVKYEYPRGVQNIFDVLPLYQHLLADPSVPAILTEGTKKADALASVYGDRALIINENGVFGWRSKGQMLEDFGRIVWEGRRVIIIPDGDVRHNQNVFAAVRRSSAVFRAFGTSEVLVCLLPQEKDGPKVGVDDYLAAGHTIADVEANLVELDTVGQAARTSLMKHPATGAPLFLPPGYDIANQVITIAGNTGEKRPFYSGLIIVTEVGQNLHTGEQNTTIAWKHNGRVNATTIPRAQLASARDTAAVLGAQGANVHAQNARDLSRYLVEFIHENHDAIPVVRYVDRLGVCGEGLILPGGTVAIDDVRYTGPAIQCGADHDAYRLALAEIAQWEHATVLWLALALSLAGPALAKMRAGRNPVLLLAGSSGAGKSTLIHFAGGQFGDPTRAPLQIQCGSGTTTAKGIAQTLAMLNGVPTHLEDIHMLLKRDPDRVAGLIYDFANGQLRTYGTLNQQTGGGQEIGGCLLMSGEMLPEFEHEGSARRTMIINCVTHPPLGVAPRSLEGARRAAVMDRAWSSGAGAFAVQVYRAIWPNWDAFTRDVARLAADESLSDLSSWKHILATAAAVLRIAAGICGLQLDTLALMRRWATIHAQTQQERNPALDAFDKVLLMLSQSEPNDNADWAEDETGRKMRIAPTWRWLNYDRKMIAAQRIGDDYWRVAVGSLAWRAMVGAGTIDQFGAAWLKENLISAHPNGRASWKVYMGEWKSSTQCILVPNRWFRDPDEVVNNG